MAATINSHTADLFQSSSEKEKNHKKEYEILPKENKMKGQRNKSKITIK